MPGPFPYQNGYGPTPAPACQLILSWGSKTRTINALIDSGASSTTIPISCVLPLSLRKIGEKNISGAINNTRHPVGVYEVNISFLGLTFSAHPVSALQKDYALIGRDILNIYTTILNGTRREFNLTP